mmetsp:Transcript_2730/g.7626  ORF Transcript_2730/g.7626 Transcript_2730/m.7626 type:complete len:1120 (-) Transcript_2730:96-3455(-)
MMKTEKSTWRKIPAAYYFLGLLLSIGMIYPSLQGCDVASNLSSNMQLVSSTSASEEPAQNCRRIFVDMGANIGMHSRFLFEPELYPASEKSVLEKMYKFLETYFGPPENRKPPSSESGICVFGFEANPQRESRLNEINNCYTSRGWDVKYMINAVWYEKSELLFKAQDGIGHGTASHLAKKNEAGVVKVDAIDIVEFMRNLRDKYNPEVVIGKLDIEGAEYQVLPALEKAGFLCANSKGAFQAITLEYHPRLVPEYPADWKVPQTFECEKRTELIHLDSEDYVKDGQKICSDPVSPGESPVNQPQTPFKLKLYIYDLPPYIMSELKDGMSRVKNHYWGTEVWIPELLRGSSVVTSNPEDADLFLVPYPGKARWMKGQQKPEAMDRFYIQVLEYIDILPYYSRYDGKDHVFIFAGGDGASRFPKWRDYIPQSIIMTPESGYLKGEKIVSYAPGRDVLIPGFVPDSLKLFEDFFHRENRKYLFFYAGKTQNVEIRQRLIDLYGGGNYSDIFVSEASMGRKEYLAKASDSKFCVIPRGISLWTSRFYELSIIGCIPVLLGTQWELPFSNRMAYHEFTLRFPELSVSQLRPLLSSISNDRYIAMRAALKQNVRRLMYDVKDTKGSAFDFIVEELSLRANNLRGMKLQARTSAVPGKNIDDGVGAGSGNGLWQLAYPIRRITHPPGFHYFGYFDKSPWSPDQTKILGGRVAVYDSDNPIDAIMEVGYTVVATGEWRTVARTTAFHYQQGCMLQWLGNSNDLIVFNARTSPKADTFCAHIVNIHTGHIRTLPRPVYALSEDGKWATSLNLGRLHTYRLGYGYVVSQEAQDAYKEARAPSDDGLHVMNVETGDAELILSINSVLEQVQPGWRLGGTHDPYTGLPYAMGKPNVQATEEIRVNYENATSNCRAWINHANIDRSGELITFLFRMVCTDGRIQLHGGHNTQQFTIERTGKELWRIPFVFGSHHDFGSKGQLLICDNYKGGTVTASHIKNKNGGYNRTISTQMPRDFGHCSYGPGDSGWIMSDTYAGSPKQCEGSQCKRLFLRKCCNPHLHGNCTENQAKGCHVAKEVGWFGLGTEGGGATRSDLHPRWSRDGSMVAIDSTHEANLGLGRQMYVVTLGKLD